MSNALSNIRPIGWSVVAKIGWWTIPDSRTGKVTCRIGLISQRSGSCKRMLLPGGQCCYNERKRVAGVRLIVNQ
jgi:hypothetical protein